MQLVLKSQEALPDDSASPNPQGLPDIARRNRMVAEMLWLVRSIATSLLRDYHFSISRGDLESSGTCGLLEAADAFDHRPGTRFNTFAYYRIRGAMLDAVRYGAGKCTTSEMTSMRRRRSAREAAAGAAANGRGEHREPLGHLTIIDHDLARVTADRARCQEEDTLTPEQFLERDRTAQRVRDAISKLRSRDRRVVELLYYRHDGSFEAVAKQLGVKRPCVFRRHARALEQLRAALADVAA